MKILESSQHAHSAPLTLPLPPSPDPYVKVWLMYKDKRVEKKKTVTKKRNLNPIFNESFAFDIPTEKLRETTIIITVMDKDKLSRNDVIGKVGLDGMHSHMHKGLSLRGSRGQG